MWALSNKTAHTFALSALLLVNTPASELLNQSLLTTVAKADSRSRQVFFFTSTAWALRLWLNNWTVKWQRINLERCLSNENEWLVLHELELSHEISKTVQCMPNLTFFFFHKGFTKVPFHSFAWGILVEKAFVAKASDLLRWNLSCVRMIKLCFFSPLKEDVLSV